MPPATQIAPHRHATGLLPVPEKTSRALTDRLGRKYADRITGCLHIPGRTGSYAPFPDDLPEALAAALRTRGITRLYSHQAQAWAATRRGEHTVVVTPTASGKTLCYTLPVLAAAMEKKAKALYLFPTKALAQDQVAELLELNAAGSLGVRANTFDGDTPTSWCPTPTCCTRPSCRTTPSGRSSSRTSNTW